MNPDNKELKQRIINAGYQAVERLITVAEEEIITGSETDITADRLKNAAATKKLAIFDAFEILSRIQSEQQSLDDDDNGKSKIDNKQGFAERNAGKK